LETEGPPQIINNDIIDSANNWKLSNRCKALICFNIYIFLATIYSIIIKFLMRPGGLSGENYETYDGVDPFEMSCFRTIFNCCVTYIVMTFRYKKSMFEVPRRLYATLMCRSQAGMLGFIAMTYAISYLPVSIFNTLLNTCPFFISILSYFVLNEKLQKIELLAMMISFIGVITLVNTKTEASEKVKVFNGKYFLGVILAMF
jgi:drug/metabolite transporter (DMT)-like permease